MNQILRINELIQTIRDMNDDEDTDMLEKAMLYYCDNWNIREGFKHALILEIEEQYYHHSETADPKDLRTLREKLNIKPSCKQPIHTTTSHQS